MNQVIPAKRLGTGANRPLKGLLPRRTAGWAEPEGLLRPPSYWERITLFIDEGADAASAIQWGLDLSRVAGAELQIVGVVPRGGRARQRMPLAEATQAVRARLEELAGLTSAAHPEIEVLEGDPHGVIAAHVAVNHPDFVILAFPRERKDVAGRLTSQLCRTAPVPIAALPAE